MYPLLPSATTRRETGVEQRADMPWQSVRHRIRSRLPAAVVRCFARPPLSVPTAPRGAQVLCWSPGQATPVHSHGRGRQAWFKVLHGELQLEAFEGKANDEDGGGDGGGKGMGGGREEPSGRAVREAWRLGPATGVVHEDAAFGLHRLSNASSSSPAVSVHVYSPPLKELVSTDDDGHRRIQPVVCYGLEGRGEEETEEVQEVEVAMMTTNRLAGAPEGLEQWRLPCTALPRCGNGWSLAGRVFANFDSFAQLVEVEFQRHGGRMDRVLEAKLTQLMRVVAFNPKEVLG